MTGLIQSIFDGVNVAAILLLVSLGLVIIFGLLKVVNMAHGELIMIGSYTAYYVSQLKINFLVGIVIAFIVTALLGALIEVLIIKRLYASPENTILATYGISLLLERFAYYTFGSSAKNVPMPIRGHLTLLGASIPYYNLIVIFLSLIILVAILLTLKKTQIGLQIRAITDNRSMSNALGNNTKKIDTLVFAFGAGIAGIAGALIAPTISVVSDLGQTYLNQSFMTVILGGVSSIFGTSLSAVIIGEAQSILSNFTDAVIATIAIFAMMIVIIRFKPEGIISKRRGR